MIKNEKYKLFNITIILNFVNWDWGSKLENLKIFIDADKY